MNGLFMHPSTVKGLVTRVLLLQYPIKKLDEVITYTKDDLVEYSPSAEKHVDTGMTLREIAEATIRYSDNTAGNILDGPKGFEKALKQIGNKVTMAACLEPALNEAIPRDIHDTSTAKTFATDLKAFTVRDALQTDKCKIPTDWMRGNVTEHLMTLPSFVHRIENRLSLQFCPAKIEKMIYMIMS
ncbi:hypothetical protein IG3_06248 [Bacillus cereus HuA2-1]|uniref:Beta-lactamase class A catalytic domain-containing protein n=1 Tax=Bacillus cereus HuA2-1 TaxID=1053201 RepID=J9B505_BACCE|nr:hypothetical protein IG3_06248 [Bacillus cereus HuA2-1]